MIKIIVFAGPFGIGVKFARRRVADAATTRQRVAETTRVPVRWLVQRMNDGDRELASDETQVTIFTVTTIHFKDARYGTPYRTVAWYPSLDQATRCVLENWGDIWETVYSNAVIEELGAGLYPTVVKEHWFAWNAEAERYEPAERPSQLKGTVSFSIG